MSRSKRNKVVTMLVSENSWNAAPTKQDYADAKKLLKDFGICVVAIPVFESLRSLQKYTSEAIRLRLSE